MKAIRITICCLVAAAVNLASAAVRYVPQQYDTIQDAVDACEDLDTVVLESYATYSGARNYNIDFKGKKITVRSSDPTNPLIVNSTVIDCKGRGHAFVFRSGEDHSSVLAGVTVTGGYGIVGGAIYCSNNSSPMITNCVVRGNSATLGGGIASTNGQSRPEISNCEVRENTAFLSGGGLYCNGGSPLIKNCVISGNRAGSGAAICGQNAGNPVVLNCTVRSNTATTSAGGLYFYDASNATVRNTILWGDNAPQAREVLVGKVSAPTSVQISYSDIQNRDASVLCEEDCTVTWGPGNLDSDPCFGRDSQLTVLTAAVSDPDAEYGLLEDSPCIDAGDPDLPVVPGETDIDGKPRLSGASVDIGAYEYPQPAIAATVSIQPKTLNLGSNGKWITCSLTLPGEYDIRNVDTSKLLLNGQIGAARTVADSYAGKLLVKFDRAAVQGILAGAENPVVLTVTGELNDGTPFEGADTIKIIK
ncbi:MAG: right-handed parallel beta-helix repeat-containing protein [Planctomycetota bacterium]|jgi:parallel beta-helix repeat protein